MQSNHVWRLLKQQSEISNQLYVGDLHVLHIVCTNVERNARHAIWSDVERNAVHAIWSHNGRLPVLFATGMIVLSDHLVDVFEGFKQLLPLRRARLRIVMKRASCWLIFQTFSSICTYQVEHSRVLQSQCGSKQTRDGTPHKGTRTCLCTCMKHVVHPRAFGAYSCR